MYAEYWTIAWVLILLSCDVSFYCFYLLVIVIIGVKTMLPQSWFHSSKLLSLLILCSCVCSYCYPWNCQTHKNQRSFSPPTCPPDFIRKRPKNYQTSNTISAAASLLLFTRNFLSPPASASKFLASVKLASSFTLQFVGSHLECGWASFYTLSCLSTSLI